LPYCGRIFTSERVVEKKVKIEKGKLKRVEKLPQVCLKNVGYVYNFEVFNRIVKVGELE